MTQTIDAIELSDHEAAAVEAQVGRLQAAGEKDLTAERLLARMTKKVVKGWADQAAEESTVQQVRILETKLRALPIEQRRSATSDAVRAIESATIDDAIDPAVSADDPGRLD